MKDEIKLEIAVDGNFFGPAKDIKIMYTLGDKRMKMALTPEGLKIQRFIGETPYSEPAFDESILEALEEMEEIAR